MDRDAPTDGDKTHQIVTRYRAAAAGYANPYVVEAFDDHTLPGGPVGPPTDRVEEPEILSHHGHGQQSLNPVDDGLWGHRAVPDRYIHRLRIPVAERQRGIVQDLAPVIRR